MTIREGLQEQLNYHLKGSQVFDKQHILNAIKEHHLISVDEIKLDSNHLILMYGTEVVSFQLLWRQDGPRYTLIEIKLV